jgi:hypothetical protein
MKLIWDDENWTTTVALPEWKAHLPAKLVRRVPVLFNPEGSEEEVEPTAAQLAAVQLVVDKQAKLLASVTAALRVYYAKMRPMMVKAAADLPQFFPNFERDMPGNPDPATFGRLHQLNTIYVQPTAVRKLAHVGFGFHAVWEVEHGVGVLVHGLEVREVGGADTVILQWVAERDAKKLAGKTAKKTAKPANRKQAKPRPR